MLRWLIRRKLAAEEKKLGGSMDYLRYVLETSPIAFFRFASIMPFAHSRKVLPADAWFVAQIVTLQHEDCGPCLQITVNLAQRNGVNSTLIHSVLNGNSETLSREMNDVYTFVTSVVTDSGNPDELRETLRTRYGDRGLIELSYAIASGRIPPTVKRVLGFAQSCSAVTVKVNDRRATE